MQALISVSDKTGIVAFAQQLAALNVRILSTGGTFKLLQASGVAATEVSQHTGFPEMLDGRVKTLHPKIHGGLLGRRDMPEHLAAMAEHGIEPIDLLVVNLYPFRETIAKPNCSFEDAIENIDIGGPAMVRAAAKNFRDVAVLTDPSDYAVVLAELASGAVSLHTKLALCKKAFTHTAQYDSAISNYLTALAADAASAPASTPERAAYPAVFNASFEKVQDLRYGENPHQSAAFYRDTVSLPGSLANYRQLQGKELSYNNIADADAAWECVKTFADTACVIIKHANPCGVATGATPLEAYAKSLKIDTASAFGGIIAFNRELDAAAAEAVSKQFVEVLIAPAFSDAALAIFKAKQNVRLLQISFDSTAQLNAHDFKRVGGGLLVQSSDSKNVAPSELRIATVAQPSPQQLADLLFAWKVAKFVKSNAIVFCGNGMTLGVGAGQMSRIDSARIASIKAQNGGLSLQGSAVASDAFFPFRDGLDVVADAGATCVIQPGGSMRDQEVIDAANERGLVMVLTGTRHFRH